MRQEPTGATYQQQLLRKLFTASISSKLLCRQQWLSVLKGGITYGGNDCIGNECMIIQSNFTMAESLKAALSTSSEEYITRIELEIRNRSVFMLFYVHP